MRLTGLVGVATAATAAAQPLGFAPNIVFVLTDDMDTRLSGSTDAYDTFGALEAMPDVKEMFVSKGAHFTNAFVNTPICCPSRTEFFSGRYYHNVGPPNDSGGDQCMHVNTDHAARPAAMIPALTAAGYSTALIGKVTNNQEVILNDLVQRKAVDFINSPLDYNNFNSAQWYHFKDGKVTHETLDKQHPVYNTTYQTAQLGNRSLDWLNTHLDTHGKQTADPKPFFLYIGPHAPHYPAEPAPWYEQTFPELQIPLTPNYNVSGEGKATHIAQNPPLSELAHCWENQHFRDRWRSLLSVQDMINGVVDLLDTRGVLNQTLIFFSSDHGYKQGQWRVGTSKQHPYETDIRIPLLAYGPHIPAGLKLPQIVGNIDLTATFIELAAGKDAIPNIVDGKSMVPYLFPSLAEETVSDVEPRNHFLVEYKSVGTYYNDHSSCWDDANHSTRTQCGGPMPRGPDPANPEPKTCVENTTCVGCGNCYFVDSTLSNNWRLLRTINDKTGEDTSYIEFDPAFDFNVTDPAGAGLQHYEFYDNVKDPYQINNTYSELTESQKVNLHSLVAQYFACTGNNDTESNCP